MNDIAKILERIYCCLADLKNDSADVDLSEVVDWLQTINVTLTEILNQSPETPTGSSCEDPTFVSVCNPTDLTAVQNLLTQIANKLDQVNINLDELEITADQINLNAEEINLNTDEVESLLSQVNTTLELIVQTIQDSQKDCDDPTVRPLAVNVCNSPDTGEEYNTPFIRAVPSGTTEFMINDSWHSVSVVCVKTPVSVLIGSDTISMQQGMVLGWTADKLLNLTITISTAAGGEAIITAMN